MSAVSKERCQRIGCNAEFTPEENPEDSCRYHPGPFFHDGTKEWSCCKQRSHDFSDFLELPGCKTGKHSSEKPETQAAPSPNKIKPVSISSNTSAANCNRCRQGFFCSDHGASSMPKKVVTPVPTSTPKVAPTEPPSEVKEKPKKIDLNAEQVCKNKSCGKTFTERENTDTACHFHPGPPIFHDRSKGWACCDIHVKEFDEFMAIPPCTYGFHNA